MQHKTSEDIYKKHYVNKPLHLAGTNHEDLLVAQIDETNRMLAAIGTVLEDVLLTLQVNRIVDGEDGTAG